MVQQQKNDVFCLACRNRRSRAGLERVSGELLQLRCGGISEIQMKRTWVAETRYQITAGKDSKTVRTQYPCDSDS
jgi:hypothetical protein